jgi:hypothetical protein
MTSPVPHRLAQFVALGRVAIGVTALCAPTIMTRPWIGAGAEGADARLLARTMGGRDLALGLGTLRALGVDDAEARPWVALAGMADAVDAAVTVAAMRRLPRTTRWAVLAATVGAAVVSFRVAVALDVPPDTRTGPRGQVPTGGPGPTSPTGTADGGGGAPVPPG